MIDYMKRHERLVREALRLGKVDAALLACHRSRLTCMQHERLIHLLVMLAVGLYACLFFLAALVVPSVPLWAVAAILIVLETVYIFHYFRLENAVQRWYHLTDEIEERLSRLAGEASCGV